MMVSSDRQLDAVQMEYRYQLTSVVVDGEEDIRYTTYGICAVNRDGAVVVSYPDVTTNENLMRQLVEQCNCGDLDVLHLPDVLIDWIG